MTSTAITEHLDREGLAPDPGPTDVATVEAPA